MKKMSQLVLLASLIGVTSVVLSGCTLGKKEMNNKAAGTTVPAETTTSVTPSADPAGDEAAVQAVTSSKTGDAAAAATTNLDATFSGLDNSINENDLDDAALGM
jgi:hypothetical protein